MSTRISFDVFWSELQQSNLDHSIWRSNFVLGLSNPELNFKLASVWASQMVSGSYQFPRYVAALATCIPQSFETIRHGLFENAWDESGGNAHKSRSHYWLAVKLANIIGIKNEDILHIQQLPASKLYYDQHFTTCSTEFLEGLGMISLIEEFTTPEFSRVFQCFMESCEKELNLTPSEFVLKGGGEYFTANIADDERHRDEIPKLVRLLFESEKYYEICIQKVNLGFERSLNLREQFFDGIFDFVDNGGTIKDLMS